MFELQKHAVAILSSALIVGCSPLFCEAGPWANPSGAAASFTYSNGQDLNGLFGNSVVSGDTLFFPDFHPAASAADGAEAHQFDIVSFDLVPNPGLSFLFVRIPAGGDFAVTGPPSENLVSTDINTGISLWENGGLGRAFGSVMLTSPSFPQSTGNGVWTGLSGLDLGFTEPPLHSHLRFQFAAGVLAISGPSGTAEIDMGLFDGLTFHFVPEPTSMSALLAGAAVLVLRRNHR